MTLGFCLLVSSCCFGDVTNAGPEFEQVYKLLREHAPGISEAELNRAAVHGLISELNPKVSLLAGENQSASGTNSLILKSSIYEGPIGYLRIGRVSDGLPQAISEAITKWSATNKLKGVVLDIRYTSGDDYKAAANTADLFASKHRPLVKLSDGLIEGRDKNDAIKMPVAVLVNRQTSQAAEVLAAVIREIGAGLVLGSNTAGQATLGQEFPLANGERLRIATEPIELGDGTKISSEGVQPDIKIQVKPEDERAYYADAFRVLTRTGSLASATGTLTNQIAGTNRAPRRPRFNEAELVRERREGVSLDAATDAPRGREDDLPTVHDPALARALDLLKGLAVVRQSRS